jgi:hypothetical protein
MALTAPRFWLALGLMGLAAVALHWSLEWFRIDSCLDAGHVYDYAREACDAVAVTLPVIPYSQRHPLLIGASVAVGAIGLAGAIVATAGARRTKEA